MPFLPLPGKSSSQAVNYFGLGGYSWKGSLQDFLAFTLHIVNIGHYTDRSEIPLLIPVWLIYKEIVSITGKNKLD